MKQLILLILALKSFSQVPVMVNEKMFVGFTRDDGVTVIYDAKGLVTVKDGFALKLETSELRLSKFLAVTDFYNTLDEARAKLGLPSITVPIAKPVIENQQSNSDLICLNCTDDWNKYCPRSLAETWYRDENYNNPLVYNHATHSIRFLNVPDDYPKQAKCNLTVEDLDGKIYVKTVQYMGTYRGKNAMNDNNHPRNVYGVGLIRDSDIRLPSDRVLRFVFENTGDLNLMIQMDNTDPHPTKSIKFSECISSGQRYVFEYNPALFVDLAPHQRVIKSNMNAYQNCNQ
jgi:hypothetical protein